MAAKQPTLDVETWKPVVGYEGVYEVSDHGRVRSAARVIRRVLKDGSLGTHHMRSRGLAQYKKFDGVRRARCTVNLQEKTHKVHQLVLEAFVGPKPEGLVCRHLDGDPFNNRLSNICWGTSAENAKDSVRHGTVARNRDHKSGKMKIAPEVVVEIVRAFRAGARADVLAARYKISKETVWNYASGKRRPHLLTTALVEKS